MALSPTIPTSFVPKQPVQPSTRHYSSGNNIFLYIALVIFIVSLVIAAGVFLYAQYLTSVESAKAAELVAAQNKVSQSTVNDFIRLHNRFVAADSVLSQHVALSQFLTLLGSITLQEVNFTSLDVSVADDRSAQITMTGTAQNFNALAAESNIFAQQKDITSAIFSGITVNKDGTVAFTLTANLKQDVVIEQAAPTTPALLAAPITATTSNAAASAAVSTLPGAAAPPASSTPL